MASLTCRYAAKCWPRGIQINCILVDSCTVAGSGSREDRRAFHKAIGFCCLVKLARRLSNSSYGLLKRCL